MRYSCLREEPPAWQKGSVPEGFRWPVLTPPQLGGFEVSTEGRWFTKDENLPPFHF